MKQEKKVDIDTLYEELRSYCFDVLVNNTNSWRGYAGGDEKMVRAKFAYINGVSDAIRYMNDILMCHSEALGGEDASDEEVD